MTIVFYGASIPSKRGENINNHNNYISTNQKLLRMFRTKHNMKVSVVVSSYFPLVLLANALPFPPHLLLLAVVPADAGRGVRRGCRREQRGKRCPRPRATRAPPTRRLWRRGRLCRSGMGRGGLQASEAETRTSPALLPRPAVQGGTEPPWTGGGLTQARTESLHLAVRGGGDGFAAAGGFLIVVFFLRHSHSSSFPIVSFSSGVQQQVGRGGAGRDRPGQR